MTERFNSATIVERREELGLTQTELAAASGVTLWTIIRWEGGRSKPDAESLVRLATALDCSTDELFVEAADG